jgi:hypothetical protein
MVMGICPFKCAAISLVRVQPLIMYFVVYLYGHADKGYSSFPRNLMSMFAETRPNRTTLKVNSLKSDAPFPPRFIQVDRNSC